MPGAGQVQQAVDELLAVHDPKTTDRRTFLEARFDAGLAWVHYPPGERVLGLPGDPRVDKDLPWRDVPRS